MELTDSRDGRSERVTQTQQLAAVLEQTRDMVALARDGEWDRVAELERGRRDGLQQCFADPVSEEQGELVAEALAVILHLNEELMALLGDARDSVLASGIQQSRTRAAVGTYQDVQHSST